MREIKNPFIVEGENYTKLVAFVQQISGVDKYPPNEIIRRLAKELLIEIGEKHWELMNDEEKFNWGRKIKKND